MVNSQRMFVSIKLFNHNFRFISGLKSTPWTLFPWKSAFFVTTNYSRVESNKITENPTNWRVEREKGTASQERVTS